MWLPGVLRLQHCGPALSQLPQVSPPPIKSEETPLRLYLILLYDAAPETISILFTFKSKLCLVLRTTCYFTNENLYGLFLYTELIMCCCSGFTLVCVFCFFRMEQNECECPCECPLEVNECTGNLTSAENRQVQNKSDPWSELCWTVTLHAY